MINFESEILFPYMKLLAVMAFMVFVIGCFLLSICQLLDMLEDRFKKILATADRADINNLKVPRKEGERTDKK